MTKKYDTDKLRYDLLPAEALEEVVEVLTHGANKYSPNNWKTVPDAHNRYFAACQRHLWAYRKGEYRDPETGLNHLAHAVCSLLFIMELEDLEEEQDDTQDKGLDDLLRFAERK